MAMHERRRIRELVFNILKADAQSLLSIPAANIFDSPSLPNVQQQDSYQDGRINVYLLGDKRVGDDREAVSTTRYLRESLLVIEIKAEKTDTYSAIVMLDGWCNEVEAVMGKYMANHLNNTVQAFEYLETEMDLDGSGDQVYGAAAVKFEVQFRTDFHESHADFAGVDTDYNFGAQDDFEDNPAAQDMIENPV